MCLGQEDAADLRAPLRASESDELLDAAIDEAIARKPKGHDFIIDRRHTAPGRAPPHERDRRLTRGPRPRGVAGLRIGAAAKRPVPVASPRHFPIDAPRRRARRMPGLQETHSPARQE